MKVLGRMLLFLVCACVFCGAIAGYAEQGDVDMSYRTEEIWCDNGGSRIYGVAYIPEAEGKFPLVIFSHEPGNNHEAGVRYAERLAAHGYAAYVFDFRGGSAGGTENRSDGSNSGMSVLTEASDLSAVLDAAKAWPFVDSEKIFLLGGSQGGLITLITDCARQDELAGMSSMASPLRTPWAISFRISVSSSLTQNNGGRTVPAIHGPFILRYFFLTPLFSTIDRRKPIMLQLLQV